MPEDPAVSQRLVQLRMRRGTGRLRMELERVNVSHEPLAAARYVLKHRPPRDINALDALEKQLLIHLGAVEDVLMHVRHMQLDQTRPPTPTELAWDPDAIAAVREDADAA